MHGGAYLAIAERLSVVDDDDLALTGQLFIDGNATYSILY
jgi:hypothetical protein